MVGLLTMGLTLCMPIVGWIVFLGLASTGAGASIIALFQRKQTQPEME